MKPVRDQAREPGHGQHDHRPVLRLALGQRVERHRHGHHAEREQHVAEHVEARHRLTQVGHQAQCRNTADDSKGQIDQEDPVPRGDLDEPSSKRRPDQRPNEARYRHEAHGRQEVLPGNHPQHGQPSNWKEHGAADALQHTRGHELRQCA